MKCIALIAFKPWNTPRLIDHNEILNESLETSNDLKWIIYIMFHWHLKHTFYKSFTLFGQREFIKKPFLNHEKSGQ